MADFNILNSDSACHGCIKKYAKKHRLKKGDKFELPCSGIPKDYVAKDEFIETSGFSAQTLLDPVTWAAQVLDWHCLDPDSEVWKRKDPEEYARITSEWPGRESKYHRPYQATMLRCTSRRKVFRIGRQAGKCLPSGTLIQMSNGTQKPIELIDDGDLVSSIDSNYNSINTPAFKACNGEKDVARITLMDGRSIEATYNHPFLSRKKIGRENTGLRRSIFHDEWKPVEELSTLDYLAVPRYLKLDTKNSKKEKNELMTILGCLIADGNITGNNCRFSNTNPVIINKLRSALKTYNSDLKNYPCDNCYDYHIAGCGSGFKHPIKNILREMKLQGLDAHKKHIPDSVMSLPDENIVILLQSMFGCDGWASVCNDGSVEIGYSTVSEVLAEQVVALLCRFGIYSTINTKVVKLNGKKFYSRQLTITRKKSIENFRNKIGILGKENAVEKVYEFSQKKNSSPKTEAYEDNDLVFIKIRSIEHVGKKMTWDLSVPETKNFIANNILTHNTESLVVSMLFSMFTNQGFKIVLITPYQSQIDLIFQRLEELLINSKFLSSSIKRNVKGPNYSMELHNGSMIKGFTAGTRSGNGAASARGQAANMLVFDEADYLNSSDMDAAMSIITNYPDATVWMSSTPQGKRDTFYKVCQDKEWKEYHHPSSVNPNWSLALEQFFRKSLTAIGYKHEVDADFGEQEEGVFQVQYVEAAQEEYKYSKVVYKSTWLYSIGVDWNSPAVGTTIRVVGFNPANSKFYAVDRKIVQRAGWTQLAACEAIIEMNRKWRPFTIYVDKGFGSTQVEVLHKYGYDSIRNPEKGPKHIDSKLPKILKPYDFGSKIITRDPFTKQPINKPAKGFLVENAARRFECGDVKIPEEDKELEEELLGYIIKNVTDRGNVVYGTNKDSLGDHNLDAFMLALVAFTLEHSAFGKSLPQEGIGFAEVDHMGLDSELSFTNLDKESKMLSRRELLQENVPETNRTEFKNIYESNNQKQVSQKLRSWTEPEEKRRPIRQNPRGGGSGFQRRGAPPKRSNF